MKPSAWPRGPQRVWRGIRRGLRLSASERRLLGRAAVLLGVVRVLLRGTRLRVVLRLARTTVALPQAEFTGSPPGGDAAPIVQPIVRAVERAARLLPGTSTCLARALVAQRLLRCAGVPAELRLGVARDGSAAGLAAHAWVVHGDRVLIGDQPQLGRYDELPSLP